MKKVTVADVLAMPVPERILFAEDIWDSIASVPETRFILREARELRGRGMRSKDALHVACAVAAGGDYLITTDDLVLKHGKCTSKIRIVDPPTFVRETADAD